LGGEGLDVEDNPTYMNDGNDMIELDVQDNPTHMNDGNDMIEPDVQTV
jgi:hypothetical protein